MKKSKRQQRAEVAAPTIRQRQTQGWLWLAAVAGLFAVFYVYSPALSGAFVLDDRYLPFLSPNIQGVPLSSWIVSNRPLLMFSYWLNYQWSGTDTGSYHVVNVLLHFCGSVVLAFIAARLLEMAGVKGRTRAVLSIFAGGLFLLHPLQTESVAYVASRSEALSVLLYYSAFAVFLYRSGDPVTPLRILAILALSAAALATKEHTLTLPLLLLLTDLFWNPGGVRRNRLLYGIMAALGAVGGVIVWRVVHASPTTGFRLGEITPVTYFLTQGRVIWTYVRLFFLPFGQNLDPDIQLSHGLLDYGGVLGLLALGGLAAGAWIYRKRWPLASYGVFVFLLLLAPTSSAIPILDVFAERRLYLPFLGLILVCLEFMRRLDVSRATWVGVAVLAVCSVLTYHRSQVWASPLTLWQDAASKSPQKLRPRFQLAYAYYEEGNCALAADNYETASHLAPPKVDLLVDWGLALNCAGQAQPALEKLQQASTMERSAHVEAEIGMLYAKQAKWQESLTALAEAEKIDPRFEMTYVYRGNVYEVAGDLAAALSEYKKALAINPTNSVARDAVTRASKAPASQ